MPVLNYRLAEVRRPFGEEKPTLLELAAERLMVNPEKIKAISLARRSLDVRHRPTWVYGLNVAIDAGALKPEKRQLLRPLPALWTPPPPAGKKKSYIIIGAGPAGLSAAYILALAGQEVTIIEQGKMVEERSHDVAALFQNGELNESSNLSFGEGGAGTYSDGKIYTRRADLRVDWFLAELARFLDEESLAIDYHAHIGTDRLVTLLASWRRRLIELGVTFIFNTAVKRLIIEGDRVLGVLTEGGERYWATGTILATGNSARRLWAELYRQGIAMEPMPAALGVRVEHKQKLINEWRYGKWANLPGLPAAEYFYSAPLGGRPCHTFCMCPGGLVIPTPTEAGGLTVNGMSGSKRASPFANAAFICEYGAQDLPAAFSGPLAIMEFQRALEKRFFAAAGGEFAAPAQKITDFIGEKTSAALPLSSYRRPLASVNFGEIMPGFAKDALKHALNKLVSEVPPLREGLLIGLESRPSNPLRILRDEHFTALGKSGLYPIGEGSGYASGITSSALDGIMLAEKLVTSLQ